MITREELEKRLQNTLVQKLRNRWEDDYPKRFQKYAGNLELGIRTVKEAIDLLEKNKLSEEGQEKLTKHLYMLAGRSWRSVFEERK